MHQIHLFLGLPIDERLSIVLKKLDPAIAEMFIGAGGEYLAIAEHKGCRYLGKSVGEMAVLAELALLQENVYSLLARLLPDYPSTQVELQLIALS